MTLRELEQHLLTGMARKALDELSPIVSESPVLIAHLLALAAGPKRPENSKAACLLRHTCEQNTNALSP